MVVSMVHQKGLSTAVEMAYSLVMMMDSLLASFSVDQLVHQ
jgi:hypothetical protein